MPMTLDLTPPDSPADGPCAPVSQPPAAAAARASQIRAAWLRITLQTPSDSEDAPLTRPARDTLDLATVTRLPQQQQQELPHSPDW